MRSPLPLLVATLGAVTPVALADLAADGHPTHSLVLVLVVGVITAIQRRLGRGVASTLPKIAAALAVQPLLHFTSEVGRARPGTDGHDDIVLHLLSSEAPTAAVQILLPALVLLAGTILAHLLCLMISAIRRPLVPDQPPAHPTPCRTLPPQPRRLGVMLQWCGWAIRAARRGPPPVLVSIIH